MAAFRWTPEQMNRLESAIRQNQRVAIMRRGVEFILVARRMTTVGGQDALVGLLPMAGAERTFPLGEIDGFQVVKE